MQKCHYIILLTCYLNSGLEKNNSNLLQTISCLSANETGDAIGFRQQLSATLFEVFELVIMVNYPAVHN